MEKCLESVDVWEDPEPRDGPGNMAVDEWLLAVVRRPTLRIYRWSGAWVSLGCFVRYQDAREAYRGETGVGMVRRWTGGGIVDHRNDWTYSLIVPAPWLARLGRPRDSYERIHGALGAALALESMPTRLAEARGEDAKAGHGLCFRNPVAGDLLAVDGRKSAGAAQRRTRQGLLHQGSVRIVSEPPHGSRGVRLASSLAAQVIEVSPIVDSAAVRALVESRYGQAAWLKRC